MLLSRPLTDISFPRTMADADGPKVAKAIYEELFKEGTEYLDPDCIPYALDAITHKMQESGVPPQQWATFIHMGI